MKFCVSSPQKLVSFLQYSIEKKYSVKMMRRLLEANLCRVNGRIERFGSTRLKKGDVVEFAPSWKSVVERKADLRPKFTTLYENGDVILVNKPEGWVCSEENCKHTFGPSLHLVHRLDKDTTGVLALAKSLSARDDLVSLFAKREVEKEYLAIVDGVPKTPCGTQESFLVRRRSFEGQTIWGSGKKGLHAVTKWNVLGIGKDAALLQCLPLTGRTHQIRVHLTEMGHPILVDRQYATKFRCPFFVTRPLLHSYRLKIGDIAAQAPIPFDMEDFLHASHLSYNPR
ncbi:MAG TPA: RluA family pseudouridine synthase [Chlamydiales bacterium]|nr:RluA family pseudouridine synthase [Chlamydiales bacterium]